MRGCAAAAAADPVAAAFDRALVAGEEHGHALALVPLERRWPHHLALLAVHDPVASLERLTRPRVVDLLSYRVAARQRRWRLAAYLCAHTALVACDELIGGAAVGRRGAAGGCAAALTADLVEVAFDRVLVAGEAHFHALSLAALAGGGPHHLALLAVHDPVAVLEGLTRPREVDLLSYRVAARQRRWRLAAYLCADTAHIVGRGRVGVQG